MAFGTDSDFHFQPALRRSVVWGILCALATLSLPSKKWRLHPLQHVTLGIWCLQIGACCSLPCPPQSPRNPQFVGRAQCVPLNSLLLPLLLKLQCIYCALKGKTNRLYFSVCWGCPLHQTFFRNVFEFRISGSDLKKKIIVIMTCVCFVSVSRCWLPILTILPGRNSVRRYQSFSTIWIRRLDFFWFIIQLLICPGFPYKSVRLESLCLETLGCAF